MTGIRGFLSESVIYGLGSVFSRLFAFFLIPIYIDVLGKSQYVNVTLIQLIFTLVTFFFALNSGVFFYYYEYKSEKLKQSIISSWLAYQLIVFGLIATILYSLHPSVLTLFDKAGNPEELLRAFVYMLLGLAPFIITNTYYNNCRIKRLPTRAVLTIISEVVLLLVLVILFIKVYNFGIDGVFLSQLIARSVVATVVIAIDFWRVFKVRFVSIKIIMKLLSYSWPYFLISSFFWVMSSVDKFLGTQLLDTHEQIAYLALASQITLPIAMFVDVIRQAYGPYVMSIRKSENANATYVAVFSLVIYLGVFIGVGLISISPILILILADESFYPTLNIIPYFALAAIVNLMIGKFSLGLNLTRNNIYIALGIIIGGVIGFISNYYLLQNLGVIGAGISQILAYFISAIIIYYFSNSRMKINYEFGWMSMLLLLFIGFNVLLSILTLNMTTEFILYHLILGGIMLIILMIIGNAKFRFWQKAFKK